jgi:hypothetical protein
MRDPRISARWSAVGNTRCYVSSFDSNIAHRHGALTLTLTFDSHLTLI